MNNFHIRPLCLLILVMLMLIVGMMTWHWSFEDTTLGGWFGFILPVAAIALAYVSGHMHGKTDLPYDAFAPQYGDDV